MVPKIHKKGTSFRGAALYLLHDKEADTTDRVAWTETCNLATNNPNVAWRVMAATAMDADRLKEKAGIRKTGRKSNETVLHVTLSWHPEEAQGLNRAELMRAARGALKALNAEDHQALIVHHDDEPQPHIHLLINRVSPTDGRMLSSSKEKYNLSRWAESYEKERGQIYCEERVLNNAARDRGDLVHTQKDVPRHIFELRAANENNPDFDQIKFEQTSKDANLCESTRQINKRHRTAQAELIRRHRSQNREIRQKTHKEIQAAKVKVSEQFRPRWQKLFHEHQAQWRAFGRREERLLGRISNAFRSIDLAKIIKAQDRRQAITETFGAMSSRGSREEALKRRQAEQTRKLERDQKAQEHQVSVPLTQRRDQKIAELRKRFLDERHSLKFKHEMERAANRAEWNKRHEDRKVAYEKHRQPGTTGGQQAQQKRRNPWLPDWIPDSGKTTQQQRDNDRRDHDHDRDR